MQTVTIWDAWRRVQITGKLIKRYPLGLTIDDAGEIRHYATYDRVVSGLVETPPAPTVNYLFERLH